MAQAKSASNYSGSAVRKSSMTQTDIAQQFGKLPQSEKLPQRRLPPETKTEKRAGKTQKKKCVRAADYDSVMLIVLATSTDTGTEFRVGWVPDKDLKVGLTINEAPNVPLLKRCFGESQVFYVDTDAEAYAHKIYDARYQELYDEGAAAGRSSTTASPDERDIAHNAHLHVGRTLSGLRIRHIPIRWPD